MAKKTIFLKGLTITSFIFIIILLLNQVMDNQREDFVLDRMNKLIVEYENMQSLMIMSDYLGENAACGALKKQIQIMNIDLWELGAKIDQYREASQDISRDQFYIDQKVTFNRREVLYYSLFKKLKESCDVNQTIISFFYKKTETCPDCDSQSFVLSDINNDLTLMGKQDEIAIFSFDADMGLPGVEFLISYYNITEFPAIMINNNIVVGLKDKAEITKLLCNESKLSIC